MNLQLDKKQLISLKKGFLGFAPKWLMLFIPLFMLMSLPILTHWIKESSEVYLSDLTIPLILSLLTSIFLSLLFLKIYLKNKLVGYAGALTATVLLGPGYPSVLKILSKLGLATSGGKFALTYVIAVILFSFFISFETYLHFKKWRSKTDIVGKSLFIIIAVAFSLQLFSVVRVAISAKPQSSYHPPSLSNYKPSSSYDKPDIYYIVFDRYTSDKVLKEQFGYDNSDFTNFLKSNGFYVKSNAYSAYPHTLYSIASTLNAEYNSDALEWANKLTSKGSGFPFGAVHYNAVAGKLKEMGYKYYQIGTQHEPTSQAPLSDRFFQPSNQMTILGHTFTTSLFVSQEIDRTIYRRPFEYGLKVKGFNALEYIGEVGPKGILSNLESLKKISDEPVGGKFVFAHYLLPHDPFYFNADGSLSKDFHNDNVGKPVKQKYLQAIQFVNSQIKELVSRVKKNSKNQAIIILQADEGGWPSQLNLEKFEKTDPKRISTTSEETIGIDDQRKWSIKDLQLKYGILAAYHMPKVKKEDMDKYMNSVNVFRLVFNSYFKDSLPYLPTCHYAFPKGPRNNLIYADITKRLTGKDNPACAPDSNFGK